MHATIDSPVGAIQLHFGPMPSIRDRPGDGKAMKFLGKLLEAERFRRIISSRAGLQRRSARRSFPNRSAARTGGRRLRYCERHRRRLRSPQRHYPFPKLIEAACADMVVGRRPRQGHQSAGEAQRAPIQFSKPSSPCLTICSCERCIGCRCGNMRLEMALAPEEILDRLDIEAGATVFVKASRRRLGLDRAGTQRLLDAFIRRLGPNGTLVMPSFPWPNDQAVLPLAYEFDLARTPSRMGLLSELFRTTPGTLRGEHYWWPICARGKYAQHLTEGQLTVRHPFGPGSSAHRLLDVPTTMVGVGVTTNYNIITHV